MALATEDLNLILNGSEQELTEKLRTETQFVEDITRSLRDRNTVGDLATIKLSDLADNESLKSAFKDLTDHLSSKAKETSGTVADVKESIIALGLSKDLYDHLLYEPLTTKIFEIIHHEAQTTHGPNYQTALNNFLEANKQHREQHPTTFAFLDSAVNLYQIGAIQPHVNFINPDNLKRAESYFRDESKILVAETTKLEAQTSRIATAENTTLGANMDIVQYLAHNGEYDKLAALQKSGISMESLNKSITLSSNINNPTNADISATVPFKALCRKDTLEFCSEKALTSPQKKFDLKIGGLETKKVEINKEIKDEIDEASNQKISDLADKIKLNQGNSKNLQKKFKHCEEIRNSEAEKIEKDASNDNKSAYKLFKLLAGILATAIMAYVLGGIGLEIFAGNTTGWEAGDPSGLVSSTLGTGAVIAGGLGAGAASYAAITKGMDVLVYGKRKMASRIGSSVGGEYKDKKFTQAVSELINHLSDEDIRELGLKSKDSLDQKTINQYYNKACKTRLGNARPEFDMEEFIDLITEDNTDAGKKHKLTQLLTGEKGINELLNSSQTDLRQLDHQQSQVTTLSSRHTSQTGRGIGV